MATAAAAAAAAASDLGIAPFEGAHMVAHAERLYAAPLARVWAIAGDTDTLNRNAGMAPVELEPPSRTEGLLLRARVKMLGLWATYEARMPLVRAPHAYAFERRFENGPMEAYRLVWRFEAEGERTRAKVTLEARLRVVARIGLPFTRRTAERELEALLDAIDVGLGAATPGAAETTHNGASDERIQRATGALRRHHPPSAVDALEALLVDGDDLDCTALRPRELARRWAVDEGALLALLFAAVDAGLLRLRWSLLCPSCRSAAVESDDLGRVGAGENHCDVCAIGFGSELDRNVEAVFVPDPGIRAVEAVRWCTGGPSRMPHVRLQDGDVHATAPARWRLPREPGAYRVFGMGGLRAALVIAEGGEASAELTLGLEAPGEPLRMAPGAALTVHVPGAFRGFVRLEEEAWRKDSLTARELFLRPEARGRVVPGSLRTNARLSLGRVGVLFTDLSGSTALYERVGDAEACSVVLDHFEVIRAAVEATQGTVLKTIGDAVLALYADERAAAAGAAAIDRAVGKHLAQRGFAGVLGLKLAVDGGPGFLVREGERLDVYGRIVNRAARLEGQASRGHVVFLATTFDALPGRVRAEFRELRRFAFDAKGFADPLEVVACAVRV
jgi:class 3 adenylate cyclase